jgi:hypothetical protein
MGGGRDHAASHLQYTYSLSESAAGRMDVYFTHGLVDSGYPDRHTDANRDQRNRCDG